VSGDHYKGIPLELLDALLDNPYESQILIDAEGMVRFVSSQARPYYGGSDAIVGKHIRELNPQSELPRVLSTGKAEIGRLFRLGERERFVARIPLKDKGGRVIGAVGKLLFWHPEKIRELLRELEVLEGRLDYYERELEQIYKSRYTLDKIVGESAAIREAKRMAIQAASSDLPVLITGETGTGKEMLAQAIHNLSRRGKRPMVKVNCAAIPPELFESELFGYEPGAFTGASKGGKPGKFELADGGTIFLDEVGELPAHLQAKLLRVIQDKEVERIGGTKPILLDFRVIAATNRDLKEMLSTGGFRKDLYYRLAIFSIRAPSLREIPEDIPRLAYHFLEEMRKENPRAPRRIEKDAMDRLVAYPWPGNARELRNVLERASLEAGRGPIKEEHLPDEIKRTKDPLDLREDLRTLEQELLEAEKRAIRKALARCGGNKTLAAKLLGIHRTVLYDKLRRHGLQRAKLRS
jgi:transcriptional regulator with PAS, ATPase and Fis domain